MYIGKVDAESPCGLYKLQHTFGRFVQMVFVRDVGK